MESQTLAPGGRQQDPTLFSSCHNWITMCLYKHMTEINATDQKSADRRGEVSRFPFGSAASCFHANHGDGGWRGTLERRPLGPDTAAAVAGRLLRRGGRLGGLLAGLGG